MSDDHYDPRMIFLVLSVGIFVFIKNNRFGSKYFDLTFRTNNPSTFIKRIIKDEKWPTMTAIVEDMLYIACNEIELIDHLDIVRVYYLCK